MCHLHSHKMLCHDTSMQGKDYFCVLRGYKGRITYCQTSYIPTTLLQELLTEKELERGRVTANKCYGNRLIIRFNWIRINTTLSSPHSKAKLSTALQCLQLRLFLNNHYMGKSASVNLMLYNSKVFHVEHGHWQKKTKWKY